MGDNTWSPGLALKVTTDTGWVPPDTGTFLMDGWDLLSHCHTVYPPLLYLTYTQEVQSFEMRLQSHKITALPRVWEAKWGHHKRRRGACREVQTWKQPPSFTVPKRLCITQSEINMPIFFTLTYISVHPVSLWVTTSAISLVYWTSSSRTCFLHSCLSSEDNHGCFLQKMLDESMAETIRKSHQITSSSTRLKSPQRGFEVKIYAHASPGLHT